MKKSIIFSMMVCGIAGDSYACVEEREIKNIYRLKYLSGLSNGQQAEREQAGKKNILQIVHRKTEDKYRPIACLVNDSVKQIEFKNWSDHQNILKQISSHMDQGELILITDTQNGLFYIHRIEDRQLPEELLHVPSAFVSMKSDTVEFVLNGGKRIELYDQKTIEEVRRAICSGHPLVVTFMEQGSQTETTVVTESMHGSNFEWHGWSLVYVPVSMFYHPIPSDPKNMKIDLDKNKEDFVTYRRNKWINRILFAGGIGMLLMWLSSKFELIKR